MALALLMNKMMEMDKKQKQTYNILMVIGLLGTIAAIFNIFWNAETGWYTDTISLVSSMALVVAAQQLKQPHENEDPIF